jgi:hypothetical protein
MGAYRTPGHVEPTLTPDEERAFYRAVRAGMSDEAMVTIILTGLLGEAIALAIFLLIRT